MVIYLVAVTTHPLLLDITGFACVCVSERERERETTWSNQVYYSVNIRYGIVYTYSYSITSKRMKTLSLALITLL